MSQSELEIFLRGDSPASPVGGARSRPRSPSPPKAEPASELEGFLLDAPAARPAPKVARPRPRPAAPDLADVTFPASGLEEFARSRGFTVTSTTGGRHNPGSKHYTGQAVDVRVRDKSPEEAEAFKQEAQGAGIRVGDERTRPPGQREWDGPHFHLEGFDDSGLADLLTGPDDSVKSALLEEGATSRERGAATPSPGAPMIRRRVDGRDVQLPLDEAARLAAGQRSAPQPSAPVEPADEVIDVSASATPAAAQPGPPELPARAALDPYKRADREERDARAFAESQPDARKLIDVRLPAGVGDWTEATGKQLAQQAARQYAEQEGIPADYVSEWLRANDGDVRYYSLRTGEDYSPAEEIGTPRYDPERRTIRVSAELPFLKKLVDDYRSTTERGYEKFARWAGDDTRTAGEKFLDVAGPPASAAVNVGGRVLRAAGGVADVLWAQARNGGAGSLAGTGHALEAADAAVEGRPTPAFAENPIAQRIRSTGTPEDQFLAAVVDAVMDPTNLIPAGLGVAAVKRLNRLAKLNPARFSRVAELFAGGGKVLKVEAAPVRAAAREAAGDVVDDAADIIVTVADAEGRPLRANMTTGEVLDDAPADGVRVSGVTEPTPAPELPETLAAQVEALRGGQRAVVHVTPDAARDVSEKVIVPRDMRSFGTPEGGRIMYNPALVDRDEVARRMDDGTLGQLMGHVEPKSAATTEVVVARGPQTGVELQSSYTSPANVSAQGDSFARQYPGTAVEHGGAEFEARVLAERGAGDTPAAPGRIGPTAGRDELRMVAEGEKPVVLQSIDRGRLREPWVKGSKEHKALTGKGNLSAYRSYADSLGLASAEAADPLKRGRRLLVTARTQAEADDALGRILDAYAGGPDAIDHAAVGRALGYSEADVQEYARAIDEGREVTEAEARANYEANLATEREREELGRFLTDEPAAPAAPRPDSPPLPPEWERAMTEAREAPKGAAVPASAKPRAALSDAAQAAEAERRAVRLERLARRNGVNSSFAARATAEAKSWRSHAAYLRGETPARAPRAAERAAASTDPAGELESRADAFDLLAVRETRNPRLAERARAEAAAMRRDAAALRDGEDVFPDPPASFSVTREPKGTRPPAAQSALVRGVRQVADVLQIPKAIRAGYDLSPFGRSSWPQVLAHPTYLRDMLRNTRRAVVSQRAADDFARSIPALPDYERMRESGLFLASLTDAGEEMFASRAARKIPGVPASARSAAVANDTARLLAWDDYVGYLAARGDDTPEALKAVAELINITTARGRVPLLDRSELGRKIVDASNVLWFSPRAMASRFNLLSPYTLVRNGLNPATRRVAYLQARDGFRALSTLGLTLALVDQIPGVDVGWNPYRPDFGKVRIGTMVVDVTAGVAHSAQFLAKLAGSFAGTAARGNKGKRPAPSPLEVVRDYFRTQLAPSPAVGFDWWTDETVRGEEFTKLGAARDLILPMAAQTFHEAWVDAGGTSAPDVVRKLYYGVGPEGRTAFRGALRGFVGVPGFGVNFYEKGPDYEAERKRAEIVIPGRAGEELKRLGINLNFEPPGDERERADFLQGEFARPPRKVESVTDTSVNFRGESDEWGHVGQTPEHLDAMRREIERRVGAEVEAALDNPGYGEFRTDAERRRYLSNLIQTVENHVLNGFRRETRGREIRATEEIKALHKRLEERKPPPPELKQPATPQLQPTPSPAPPADELEEFLLDESEEPEPPQSPGWEEFSPESGSLGIPRAAMPQIKGEHRGALVQFLKARGIAHSQEEVAADSLKPSQSEYSPEKVERAKGFEGPERSILVSSDDYVADGHHQWLSKRGARLPVIRLHAPIQQLLIEIARFPSSGVDDSSKKG